MKTSKIKLSYLPPYDFRNFWSFGWPDRGRSRVQSGPGTSTAKSSYSGTVEHDSIHPGHGPWLLKMESRELGYAAASHRGLPRATARCLRGRIAGFKKPRSRLLNMDAREVGVGAAADRGRPRERWRGGPRTTDGGNEFRRPDPGENLPENLRNLSPTNRKITTRISCGNPCEIIRESRPPARDLRPPCCF